MAKISKLRIYVSSGGLFTGGLLTVYSSRMGAYSWRGGVSRGGFEDLRY